MEINWFTVIAQVINFFILVWLLKRFLYKPILKAIDERENKIVAQLKEAELKKAEAAQEQEEFQQKNKAFDTAKDKRMATVQKEADQERQQLLDQASAEAEALTAQLTSTAKAKQEHEQLHINQKIAQEVFAVSRQALTDLASSTLEAQLLAAFTKRLEALNKKEVLAMKTAFENKTEALSVQTARALSAAQQDKLKQLIDKTLGKSATLHFAVIPKLISGIELSTTNYKLAWSLAQYLQDFEDSLNKNALSVS